VRFHITVSIGPVGYVANPQGLAFTDVGVGGMLSGPNNPNPVQWRSLKQIAGTSRGESAAAPRIRLARLPF
jgi:hypothetical protein